MDVGVVAEGANASNFSALHADAPGSHPRLAPVKPKHVYIILLYIYLHPQKAVRAIFKLNSDGHARKSLNKVVNDRGTERKDLLYVITSNK